ncbi:MAG: hypothetical protein ACRDI2_07745 [Chloroflexota bacterium]
MNGFAVYAHRARDAHWDLKGVFATQHEADQFASSLIDKRPDLEYDDDTGYAETIVETVQNREQVPERLPVDRVAPVTSRFVREGLAG